MKSVDLKVCEEYGQPFKTYRDGLVRALYLAEIHFQNLQSQQSSDEIVNAVFSLRAEINAEIMALPPEEK